MLALPAACGEPKPVAIVASGGLGEGDRRFFEYYVTAALGVVSEDRGDFLEPAEFGNYSMVVWLRECPRKFTPQQTAAAKAYVESGGQLLMTNGAVIGALERPFKAAPWIGAATWAYARRDGRPRSLARRSLPGRRRGRGRRWLGGPHALLKFEGVSVLGKPGEFTTLGYIPLGAGRFIFSTYGPYDCRDEPTKAQVLRHLSQPRVAGPAAHGVGPGRGAAQRGGSRSQTGPLAAGLGRINRVPADLAALRSSARGPARHAGFRSCGEEIDTAFFCVQAAADVGEVHLKSEPSPGLAHGAGRIALPGTACAGHGAGARGAHRPAQELRQSGPLPPGTVLLDPCGEAGARGQAGVPVGTVRAENGVGAGQHPRLGAGSYTSRLVFSAAGGESLAELPVRVEVAPILMPDPRIVQLRTWGGGIGADLRLVREMGRQRCDEGVISYPDAQKIRLRNTETTLQDALLRRPPAPRPDSAATSGLHAPVERLAGPVPRPRHHVPQAQGHPHRPVVGRRRQRPEVRRDRAL